MNKSIRPVIIGLCVLLSCMTLFLSVGYAAITGHILIDGSAVYNDPATVFIRNVRVSSSKNTGGTASVTKAGFVVFQHGDYSLNRKSNSNNSGGTVTIEVVVENNSDVGQYFVGHSADPALASGVTVTYSGIKVGELIESKAEPKTFTITIQNTTRNAVSLNNVISTLEFSPVFDESFTEDASHSVAEIFENVLAGTGIDGNGKGVVYNGREIAADEIMSVLTDAMESVDTGGYIGNVGNASQEQKDLIAAIFGDEITMQIGNQHYSVSLLIKNQQIDGKGENDMVIYVTADQLAVGGGQWRNNAWQDLNIVPVYGIVFINNGKDGYSYCDHLFLGEAPVCNFGGEFGQDKIGNFNTNLWNSTEYPSLTDKSSGQITQSYITKNGELDEAYAQFVG